jgi:hypothetical protein
MLARATCKLRAPLCALAPLCINYFRVTPSLNNAKPRRQLNNAKQMKKEEGKKKKAGRIRVFV